MNRDVHVQALEAAARVAFSLALLTGCSAAPDAADTGESTESTESDLKKKAACDAGPARPSCDALIASAFPTEGHYPGKAKKVSAEVKQCCTDRLLKDDVSMTSHRWDCCANANPGAEIGVACTPWGPPVPPAMRRIA